MYWLSGIAKLALIAVALAAGLSAQKAPKLEKPRKHGIGIVYAIPRGVAVSTPIVPRGSRRAVDDGDELWLVVQSARDRPQGSCGLTNCTRATWLRIRRSLGTGSTPTGKTKEYRPHQRHPSDVPKQMAVGAARRSRSIRRVRETERPSSWQKPYRCCCRRRKTGMPVTRIPAGYAVLRRRQVTASDQRRTCSIRRDHPEAEDTPSSPADGAS